MSLNRSNPFDHRDQDSKEPGRPVFAPGEYEEEVARHVARTIGPHSDLFHEPLTIDMHLDVLMVPPAANRRHYTLVTCGMGACEMQVPPELRHFARMELALCLPEGWPPFHTFDTPFSGHNAEGMRAMEGLRFTDNDPPVTPLGPGAWIMTALNFTAKIPVRYDTYFDEGHTIPNGDPPEPVAFGSDLCCTLLSRPRRIKNPAFRRLKLSDGSQVRFMSLILIHRNEMEFKLRRGYEALSEKFDENGVDELLDLDRPSVCRGGLLGRFGF